MEFFPNGGFVRLQSRGNSKYVHADGDWLEVSLRQLGPAGQSLESVWRVEHVAAPEDQGGVYVLLQNAAYGRYLSFSPYHARPGHRGRRAVQADRNEPPNNVFYAHLWWWRVDRVHPNQDYVRLRHADSIFDLRANGRYRTSNTGVTIDRRRLTTMMQWLVHPVPASPQPLPLPAAPPQPPQQQLIRGGRRRFLFWRRSGNRGPGVYQHPGQTIRHVRASDAGVFDPNHHNWSAFTTYDHSVINLRTQLGQLNRTQQGESDGDLLGFTLCLRPGFDGRLMPLVTDLPRSLDPIDIVVLRTGSPAAAALMYPQIDAPAQ